MIAGGVTLHNNNNDKKKYFHDDDDEQNKEKIEMTNMRVANTRDKPEIMEPSTSKRMKVDGKLHLSPPHTVSLLWSDDDDDGDGKKGKDYEKDRDDETAQIYRISSSMANLCLPASSSFSSDKMSDGTQPMMMKRLNASLSSGLSKLDGVSEKVKKKCYGSTPTLIEGHNPSGVLECGDNDDECYGFFADLDDDEDDNCLSSTRYYEDPYRESTQRGSFACEVASLAFTAPVAPASIRVSVEQDAKIVWAQAADTVDDYKYTVRIVRTKNSILPLVNLTSTKSIVSTNHGSIVVIHMAGEDQIEDLAIPASRPLLIFNHNPKAGGGSILEVLREFKTQISCIKDKKEYGRCSAETWEQAFADDGAATSFVHVCEFCSTGRSDRVHGFIIGSIREPCSQYLSLWAFGSNGNGLFRHQFENDGKGFYGKSPPYFNTTSDKVRFQAWMKHPKVTGVVGDRVKQSYGESVLDSVDCWVFVEDFRRSLLNCLRLYEEQGGIVDWEAPLVEGLQQQQQQDPGKVNNVSDNGIRKASSKDDLTKASKNDPIGDPRSGHHGKCLPMFDDEVSKQVEEQNESFIYKLFGYEACCVPGSNFYPRIASSTAGKAGDASSLPSELLPTATSVGAMIAVTFLLTILLSIRKRLSRVTTTSTKKSAVELQCMLSNDYLVKKEENKVP